MSVIPQTNIGKIEFCEAHWPVWQTQAANIGVTSEQVSDFKNLTTAARAAYDAAQSAKQAWRGAVTAQNAAISAMIQGAGTAPGASDLIRVIKGFAELQEDPATVYALAEIPLPSPPTPATAPGTPDSIVVTLEPTGAITLSWEADNAAASSGAWFNVMRKLPGETAYRLVGGAPGSTAQSRRMSYTDFGIPTSAAGAGAMYIIQGRRAAQIGDPSDAIVVQFGVDNGGGGMFAINGISQPMKMAA